MDKSKFKKLAAALAEAEHDAVTSTARANALRAQLADALAAVRNTAAQQSETDAAAEVAAAVAEAAASPQMEVPNV